MHIMKKTIIILFCSSLAVACGNSSDNSSAGKKDSSASTNASAPAAAAADEKGLELIGSSDCTTCHRLQKEGAGSVIGPAYSEVAAKYAPAADSTVDRLVKKIISGGTGVWGQVPMTPHPLLAEADVREMVKYILSLKK
jgi:cytochrome c